MSQPDDAVPDVVTARSHTSETRIVLLDVLPPFEQIVAVHGPRVLRVCRAVLGAQDADDAWSETFLSAMRAYPQLPADANVEAWLVTIAHRKAIDVTRSRARLPVPVDERPGGAGQVMADPSVSVVDREHGLWSAVAALPDKQRHVLAYRFLGGLTHNQIAEIVGGTATASRRACADALNTLRSVVGADHGEQT